MNSLAVDITYQKKGFIQKHFKGICEQISSLEKSNRVTGNMLNDFLRHNKLHQNKPDSIAVYPKNWRNKTGNMMSDTKSLRNKELQTSGLIKAHPSKIIRDNINKQIIDSYVKQKRN